VVAYTSDGTDVDSLFDVKVIYRQDHAAVDLGTVPPIFLPRVAPLDLIDYEKVFAADPACDIFEERGIDDQGAVVVVRPDQYVAGVLPLWATDELSAFFGNVFLRQHVTKQVQLVAEISRRRDVRLGEPF
jgi:phenol 2-monooxygenase